MNPAATTPNVEGKYKNNATMAGHVRRSVTTHNAAGEAVVHSDEHVPR